jgi:hypothetical protein
VHVHDKRVRYYDFERLLVKAGSNYVLAVKDRGTLEIGLHQVPIPNPSGVRRTVLLRDALECNLK